MRLVGIDYETYYDPATGYTLSKMTTEEYCRDPRFEQIMVAVKLDAQKAYWVPKPEIRSHLRSLRLEECAVYAHHAHFDGLILAHHDGIRPRLWLDTLGMARALYGVNGRLSLAQLCEREGIGSKGHEVENVKGMRYADFTPEGLARYGDYSVNDIEKTYLLVQKYAARFDRTEIEIHDQVIRMFTEPLFELDADLLETYRKWLSAEKLTLLMRAGVQLTDIMSAEKFADCLRSFGIEPPRKLSPTAKNADGTPKLTYAFAKTDHAMQELQEHPDEEVQILVEARLKNKTTLAERSAERLIGVASRGRAPIYLKYAGASGTHRLSAGDKFNSQAMKRGSDVRRSFRAPPGCLCVVVDSSTIEARLLDWIAGQDDMVEVYKKQDSKTGPDMYCFIAGHIYGRVITKKDDPDERQMGKVCVAEGSLVLTDTGLVPVENITLDHRLWDGVEWVTHDGVICNGEKEIIEYEGLRATPDHEVFTEDGRKISLGQAASEMARIICTGIAGAAVRAPGNCFGDCEKDQGVSVRRSLLPQFKADSVAIAGFDQSRKDDEPAREWEDSDPARRSIGTQIRCGICAVYRAAAQAVQGLRRPWNRDAVRVTNGVYPVRTGASAGGFLCWPRDRSYEQRWALRAWQSPVGYAQGADRQSPQYADAFVAGRDDNSVQLGKPVQHRHDFGVRTRRHDGRTDHREGAGGSREEAQELGTDRRTARVYDILNAGPRHRFTVSNLLVANCKLGLGFGMGENKFIISVRRQAKGPDGKPLILSPEFAHHVVSEVYRKLHKQVGKFWKRCDNILKVIASGETGVDVDYRGIVKTCRDGLIMPNGLTILYPDLKFEPEKDAAGNAVMDQWGKPRGEWSFWNGKMREHIYGPKVAENIIQCLARIIVFNQCLMAVKECEAKGYPMKWKHSVHDEGVFIAPAFYAPVVQEVAEKCFRTPLAWCESLPLNCEGGIAVRYGDAKS